jgi:hypothetical protein
MSTLREAIHHARAGGIARLGDTSVRFLTREEAEPILLATRPDRIVVDGAIEEIAPSMYRLQRLGLYNVGQHPPVEFRPTDEDIASQDWVRDGVAEERMPETVSPEAVDEALHEEPI